MSHLLASKKLQGRFVAILALFVICFVTGVLFYHYHEGLGVVDSIYFTAMTLTTVGYGDIAPQSDTAKLFTALYALIGVGVFLGLAASIIGATLAKLGVREAEDQTK